MQNPVFYGAFLGISWIKPRAVVTNYSECMRSDSAYRDAYVTRSQTQSLVCLWPDMRIYSDATPQNVKNKAKLFEFSANLSNNVCTLCHSSRADAAIRFQIYPD